MSAAATPAWHFFGPFDNKAKFQVSKMHQIIHVQFLGLTADRQLCNEKFRISSEINENAAKYDLKLLIRIESHEIFQPTSLASSVNIQ